MSTAPHTADEVALHVSYQAFLGRGLTVNREASVSPAALRKWRDRQITAETLVGCTDGSATVSSIADRRLGGGLLYTNVDGWLHDVPA